MTEQYTIRLQPKFVHPCEKILLLGENALHMAIVIEDPSMVKFLLDKGADYHERCCGNFFTPDDQKDSRTDSMDHEWVDVCQKTNYEGLVNILFKSVCIFSFQLTLILELHWAAFDITRLCLCGLGR